MKRIIQRIAALIVGLGLGFGALAGLETVTHISDLNSSWPLGSDLASTSDDHIRNIKVALKTDFPNINAAVTGTPTQLNALTANITFSSANAAFGGNVSVGGATLPANGIYLPAANTLGLASNTTQRAKVDSGGAWTFNAPTSGTAVTVSAAASSIAALFNGPVQASNLGAVGFAISSSGSNYGLIQNDSSNNWSLATGTGVTSLGTPILKWNSTGNVVIAAPSSGVALAVTGVAGASFAGTVSAPNSAGSSNGLTVSGGTNATDVALKVNNAANTTTYFRVVGDGSIQGNGPVAGTVVDMTPDTGTFTATYTGMSSATTCTATWSRIGKLATLFFCAATGTSNATSFTMTGLPSAIQPASLTQRIPVAAESFLNNGSTVASLVTASVAAASGTVTFFIAGSSSGWTGSANKGVQTGASISFLLN